MKECPLLDDATITSTVDNELISTKTQYSNAKHFRKKIREDSLTPLPTNSAQNNEIGTSPMHTDEDVIIK